ncbi:hypothetical protein MRB53_042121 [Persea americana]|nr:hypothetical protein MRB53_042121 [Persea americana]
MLIFFRLIGLPDDLRPDEPQPVARTVFPFTTLQPLSCLVVGLWKRDSTVILYKDSDRQVIHSNLGPDRFIRPSPDDLHSKCKEVRIRFPEGGWMIFDARLSFKVLRGRVIIIGLAEEELYEERVKKIGMTAEPFLQARVAQMDCNRFRFNVDWEPNT